MSATFAAPRGAAEFGGELRHVIYDQIGGVVTRGRFGFDGRYTQNPLLPAAQRGGAAFADFLLGTFNNSEAQVGAPIANFRSNYFALYAQDSWRLGSNVTMNYGLRSEVPPAVHGYERRDREHRLRLGQHACAGVRPRGHGRSV